MDGLRQSEAGVRGDAQFARGFTLLLSGLGLVLFAVMSLAPVTAGPPRGNLLRFLAPPPGEFDALWSCLGALLLAVALLTG